MGLHLGDIAPDFEQDSSIGRIKSKKKPVESMGFFLHIEASGGEAIKPINQLRSRIRFLPCTCSRASTLTDPLSTTAPAGVGADKSGP